MIRLLFVFIFCTVFMNNCLPVSCCIQYVAVSTITPHTGYHSNYHCVPNPVIYCAQGFSKTAFILYHLTYTRRKQCCSGYGPLPDCPPICSSPCGTNKQCTAPNTCTCVNGWTGSDCLTPICSLPCGTNKNCTAPDNCTCINGWTGNDCLTPICNPPCGTNKVCSAPNTCTCASGYGPLPNCPPICNPSCGTNQWCSAPNHCPCYSGYGPSPNCPPICNPPCGTNKVCSAPNTCTCASGYGPLPNCPPICNLPCGTNQICSSPSKCTCASGYGPLPNCPPICSPSCGINKVCSAPHNCTCVNGWTSNDCLTDIDECLQNLSSCQLQCTNTIGSYYCSCDTSSVLANDGIHCLGTVQNMTISELSSTHCKIQWSPPFQYTQYGSFDGYVVTCNITNTTIYQELYLSLISLKPYTHYICCIKPQWTTNGTGKSKCMNFITLEDAPEDPPVNIVVIVIDAFSLLIQWEPPLIPNGIITHYTLYINYTNGSEISTRTVDSQFTLYLLEGLTSYQEVGVSISATTGGGEGPLSQDVYNTTDVYNLTKQTDKTSNETSTNNKIVMFSVVSSVGAVLLVLCAVCGIIIGFIIKNIRSKRHNLKAKELEMQGVPSNNTDNHYTIEAKFDKKQHKSDISPNRGTYAEILGSNDIEVGVTLNETKTHGIQNMTETIYEVMDDAECYETPVPTKVGRGKVKESSCVNATSRVDDCSTVTAREVGTSNCKEKTQPLKMVDNNSYGSLSNARKKPVPLVPPKKSRVHATSDADHFKMEYNFGYGKGMCAGKQEPSSVSP